MVNDGAGATAWALWPHPTPRRVVAPVFWLVDSAEDGYTRCMGVQACADWSTRNERRIWQKLSTLHVGDGWIIGALLAVETGKQEDGVVSVSSQTRSHGISAMALIQ